MLIAALALGFAAGLGELFNLRFESGDVYPAYSSFRPDPLGTRALYESIALQPGVTVLRNTVPLKQVHGRNTTVFLLGLNGDAGVAQLQSEMAPDIERLAGDGARVVIAFLPEWRYKVPRNSPLERPDQPSPKQEQEKKRPAAAQALLQKLGVSLAREHATNRTADVKIDEADLPRHTALWFDRLAPEWTVVQTWRDHPVLIERRWKAGSVVLIADSWMLSNDALSKQPDAQALSSLVGPNHTVVFDESHLGIEEAGSIAGLMRRYHLVGAVLALLVLAALFIWKNAAVFPPRAPAARREYARLRGGSSAEGLVCLLTRSIPQRELAAVCAAEYLSLLAAQQLAGWQRERLESALAASSTSEHPAAAYQLVHRTLEEIRHPWKQTSSS